MMTVQEWARRVAARRHSIGRGEVGGLEVDSRREKPRGSKLCGCGRTISANKASCLACVTPGPQTERDAA